MGWKLKRVRQCAHCPWKAGADPRQIPNGYSEELHRRLVDTLAEPGRPNDRKRAAMACHEHPPGEEAHCVGWLMHQLGPGNNIGLRLAVRSCDNIELVQLDGPQHERFEDTLPRHAAGAEAEEA